MYFHKFFEFGDEMGMPMVMGAMSLGG